MEAVIFNYIILTFLCGLLLATIFLRKRYQYWTERGVFQLEPTWIFGNIKPLFFGNESLGEFFTDWYRTIRNRGLKYAGGYMFAKPFFVPVDPDVIKRILTSDFQSFMSHAMYSDEESDPLTGNLFTIDGQKWKNLRTKLTPTFTSGKIKMMFNLIRSCAIGLQDMLMGYAKSGEVVDIKDILGRFTTDVIGTCAFGIDCNSIKDPNTPFRLYGKKIFQFSKMQIFKTAFMLAIPKYFSRALGLKVTERDVEKFFFKVVRDTVNYREHNNVVRKDFVHLLLQLKNKGRVTEDDDFKSHDGRCDGMSMNELTAQAFFFFSAGFETSSSAMTYALYELAVNQQIQGKVRDEINETLMRHNGEVTYDSVMEMKYLDRVFSETLRLHSPVTTLPRGCTKDYKIPGTDTIITKGTCVFIPILGLQLDEKYYPDPMTFDPERFTEENKARRPSFTYLPFGEGPRICIGLKFGVLQSKLGLISIIRNYRVTLNERTELPLQMDPRSQTNNVKGGVWINITKV